MSGPNFFLGNNWFTFWDSSQGVSLPNRRIDGTDLLDGDTLLDIRTGTIRQYAAYSPPGYVGWQPAGILGDSNGDPINFGSEVEFDIIDTEGTATAWPSLSFSCLNPALNTIIKKFTVVMNNDNLYIKQGDISGTTVFSIDAAGNATFANNVTVIGDLFADDVSYDENTCNILKVQTAIQHNGNLTNQITFGTDIMTLDANGTSIVLDDTAMSNNVTINGSTKFNNNIDDIPDIYLRNHVHHYADVNTRIGFPAVDQIQLRTSGVDNILITPATYTLNTQSSSVTHLGGNQNQNHTFNLTSPVTSPTLIFPSQRNVIVNSTETCSGLNAYAFYDTLTVPAQPLGGAVGYVNSIITAQQSGSIFGINTQCSWSPGNIGAGLSEWNEFWTNHTINLVGSSGQTYNITNKRVVLAQNSYVSNAGAGSILNITNFEGFTNSRAWRFGGTNTTTTITNLYGLRLIAPSLQGTTTITNRYNISQEDPLGTNYFNANVGIATNAPTAKLDVNSDIIRLRTRKTPASATATGNAGDICFDTDYVYACTATNTWKRSPLSTWPTTVSLATFQTRTVSTTAAATSVNKAVMNIGSTHQLHIQLVIQQSTTSVAVLSCDVSTANNSTNVQNVSQTYAGGAITFIGVYFNSVTANLEIQVVYTGAAPTIYLTAQGHSIVTLT